MDDITSGKFDEIAAEAKAEMVPLFEQSPGFVSYAVAQVDDTKFVSLSTIRGLQHYCIRFEGVSVPVELTEFSAVYGPQ